MKKTEIDSILLVNLYFTGCKINNPKSKITDLVGKYLSKKVTKALVSNKVKKQLLPNKALMLASSLFIYFVGI